MTDSEQIAPYADLGTFPEYRAAQALVDDLSDAGFEVGQVRIVGNNLHSVEQVTGRLTVARAAAKGAGSGAWFGLFIGGFVTFFAPGSVWIIGLVAGLVVGAVAGAVYSAIAHALTHGRRDFSSFKTVEASDYTVMVVATEAAEASRLARL